jgi:hypothetical protein
MNRKHMLSCKMCSISLALFFLCLVGKECLGHTHTQTHARTRAHTLFLYTPSALFFLSVGPCKKVLCAAQNLCWNDNKRNGNPLVRWIILEEHRTTPMFELESMGGGLRFDGHGAKGGGGGFSGGIGGWAGQASPTTD